MPPVQAPQTTPTPDTYVYPLAQSVVYTYYLPIIIICIASFYATVYVMRYLHWQYRRRRKHQLWLERGRLRLFWVRATARQKQEIPVIPPPVARPATFPNNLSSITSTSSSAFSYVMSTTGSSSPAFSSSSTTARPHSVIGTTVGYDSATTLAGSACSNASHSTMKRKKWRSWTQSKKRRRRLIWQWSVSMGYCRYSHASRIESVVQQLKERDEKKLPS
ncbi:hypothetical protein BJV82DRAFT_601351 [Fennellomyces sp. T-0311]|nr:hypothetical protein BJV82DRAFT_601351 [Fennellomyces sp. T-0311]